MYTSPQGVRGWVLIWNAGVLPDSYTGARLALGQQPAPPHAPLKSAAHHLHPWRGRPACLRAQEVSVEL